MSSVSKVAKLDDPRSVYAYRTWRAVEARTNVEMICTVMRVKSGARTGDSR